MKNGKIVDQYWYVDIETTDTMDFDTYEEAYDFYMKYREENPESWITLGCVTDRVVGTFADRDPPDPYDDGEDEFYVEHDLEV